MKINELSIKGFQSHRSTKLKFSDGVNAIIGESDSGKSAILRAIRLVAFNEPAGDSFRSKFPNSPSVEVTVKLETGDEITVSYENGKRVYFVNGERFIGFGRNIPDAVKKAFPLDRLNMALQFDPAFMVSATPASVGQMLSELLGLEDAQELFSRIGKREYALKTELGIYEKQLEEAKERIEALRWVETAEKLYPEIDNELANLDEDESELADYKELLRAIQECENELSTLDWVGEVEDLLISVLEHVQILESNSAELQELFGIYESILGREKLFGKYGWIETAEKLVSELEIEIDGMRELEITSKELKMQFDNVINLVSKIKKMDAEISNFEKRFSDELGEVCPLCGQPVKGGHIHG